jgi:GPH family glycoside/pentoside/hexuronide:cation symporter
MTAPMPLRSKIGYAFGDYGCNLYWQSISFFLLFFYTDVVGIPVALAGLIYMIASIFDGCIDPVFGALMERVQTRWGRYRPWLLLGALPLALSFTLLYWRPPLTGVALAAELLVAHLLFRVCYTLVAVPLASLSARLTTSSSERTTLASLRMLFGAGATATVGFVTQPLAASAGAHTNGNGLMVMAAVIGIVACIAFGVAFASTREVVIAEERPPARGLGSYATAAWRNHAFLALAMGLLCAAISTTALNKSLLYYFKYVVHDEGSARYALASSALISLVFAPVWAILGRRVGKRRMWLTAVGTGLFGLALFVIIRPTSAIGATMFFMWMQTVTVGLQVGYWGTLPDTVEYGEWRTGIRQESFLFGLFMFFQKAGLGLAAGLFGLALSAIGYDATAPVLPSTVNSLGLVMAGLSALGLVGSGVATFLSPLRMGRHEEILTDLRQSKLSADRGLA